MATAAGFSAFKRVYESPAQVQGGQFESRSKYYDLLWAYYNTGVFDDIATWARYRAQYRLYRQIRLIYSPVRRLVDFYAGAIYPGVLSEDGADLPDGVALAIPLADDTPPALKAAIGQWWQWTNFQSGKSLMVRYGAATGSVLVEVVDDLERGKVTANIVWPGLVADLQLDATGNVKAYAVEYDTTDDRGQRYTFRKEIDQKAIRFYRDNRPFDPDGMGSTLPNPYGFVPAVWAKHRDLGGDHGAPAIHGSLGKVDELNSLASHIHDSIHKTIGAPVIMWSKGTPANLLNQSKRGSTEDLDVPEADRESMLLLHGPEGGRVDSLNGNLSLGDSLPYLDKLIGEIEQDHPELAMYRELRAMTQVTGPGAARMMGDVASMVVESQAAYDQQVVKLHQMAVAIAGWRASRGDWGPSLTRQQAKFLPFDLTSYERGDLDFAIMPRPLIPLTPEEQISRERAQLSLETDRIAMSADPMGIEQRLRQAAQ